MKSSIGRAAALILPVLLAGCTALPGTTQNAVPSPTAQAPVALAQVTATAQQTMPSPTAQGTAAVRQGAAGTGNPPAAATAVARNNDPAATATPTTAPSATTTSSPSTTASPRPSPTASPRPSATASPRPSNTPSVTAVPTPVILAPTTLREAEVGGSKLYPRYWTNTRAIAISMTAAPGTSAGMRPEVEIEPLAKQFTGQPTAEGALMPPTGAGTVTVEVSSWAEGPYHWQARLADDRGHAGPWVDYYQGPAFRIDRTPPEAPVISSSTHPNQHRTYSAAMAELSWTKPYDNGGIQGYLIGIDRNPHGLPSGPLIVVNRTTLGPLRSGTLYFHVRAEDWAGNLGKIASFVLHIDHRGPVLAHAFFDRFQFNPQFDTLSMHFVPDKTVQVTIRIRRQSSQGIVRVMNLGKRPAASRVTVTWNGRNQRGIFVHSGLYTLEIYAVDALGNVGDAVYTDLAVNYKRIVIHLSSQSLDAYDGNTLLQHTLVTTGNQHLPTPAGIWHVMSRYHPYKFISPWPKSSPYWYPTSAVNYALNFHAGGYFIHDAPWRGIFGPGTNSAPGLPGSGVYAGSHGCVETPVPFAQWLYNWAPIGTVVDVVQ
ncbi:MAG TPA: L,D-transpeptidase family protein [Chloroflexota bacterium]|nr:L,D-transpeptidase family protein [Chloroflexota bacterium]